jgi:hypothetical protein
MENICEDAGDAAAVFADFNACADKEFRKAAPQLLGKISVL